MIERDMSNDYIKAIDTQGKKTINEVNTSVVAGTESLEVYKDLKLKQIKNSFDTEVNQGKQSIETLTSTKLRDITSTGNSQVSSITNIGNSKSEEITRIGNEAVRLTEISRDQAIKEINNTGGLKINALARLGQEKVEAITKEGDKQFNRVATKGEEEYQRIIATGIDGKVSKTDIVNDLTTSGANKVLSAEMGKVLNDTKFDKSGGDITGTPQIKKHNPYIYFDDTRTPDQPRGFVGYGSKEGIFQVANGRSGYSVNLHPNGDLKYNQYKIFHEGNSPIQKSANGYTKLPNGLIIQWGAINRATDGTVVTLPTTFLGNWSIALTYNFVENHNITYGVRDKNPNQFALTMYNVTNPVYDMEWIAIGF